MGYNVKRFINDRPVTLDELMNHTITNTTVTNTIDEVIAKNNKRYHDEER